VRLPSLTDYIEFVIRGLVPADVRDALEFQHVQHDADGERAATIHTFVDGPREALKHVVGSRSHGSKMTIIAVQRVLKVAGYAQGGVYIDLHVK